jgi:hypothetical protein
VLLLLPPGPDGAALRLVLLAELVSAAGFQRDRLYVEWQLHFDPELWVLQHSEQEVVQPGLIQVRVRRDGKGTVCASTTQPHAQQQWQQRCQIVGAALYCSLVIMPTENMSHLSTD